MSGVSCGSVGGIGAADEAGDGEEGEEIEVPEAELDEALVVETGGGGGSLSAATDSLAPAGPRAASTPRPTSKPIRKMPTAITVTAMNRKTSAFPLSWISRKESSWVCKTG